MTTTSKELLKEILADDNPDAYIYDGADEAILGVIYLETGTVLAYSYSAYINMFMERDEMSFDDAVEFFDFNVAGLRLGEHQPIIVDDMYINMEIEEEVDDSA